MFQIVNRVSAEAQSNGPRSLRVNLDAATSCRIARCHQPATSFYARQRRFLRASLFRCAMLVFGVSLYVEATSAPQPSNLVNVALIFLAPLGSMLLTFTHVSACGAHFAYALALGRVSSQLVSILMSASS